MAGTAALLLVSGLSLVLELSFGAGLLLAVAPLVAVELSFAFEASPLPDFLPVFDFLLDLGAIVEEKDGTRSQ